MSSSRLNAIKSYFCLFPKTCFCCKKKIIFNKVYKVNRWKEERKQESYYYCIKCAPSKSKVLKMIDTDNIKYGIANVDGFWWYEKKYNIKKI